MSSGPQGPMFICWHCQYIKDCLQNPLKLIMNNAKLIGSVTWSFMYRPWIPGVQSSRSKAIQAK